MTKNKEVKNKKQMKQTKTVEIKVAAPKTEKLCPKCGQTLGIANFPHDFRRKDGLYIYCRKCESARQYAKHTRTIIKNAEENGYIVLKANHPTPITTIDVLKIDVNPTTGWTIETTLAPSE